jgi:DNA (cytosine-5)-methyltransferase 1
MTQQLAAISLFSGAGGMDVGFHQAGFEIQWANDADFAACETYSLNNLGPIRHGNIESHWHELDKLGHPALVFGGPPCQGFSVAGKMDPSDSRNVLMARFFDVVERKRPLAFVCENVKAVAALTRWEGFRERLRHRIDAIGYHHELLVLNAANYGVPQSRERMFLVGFSKRDFSFGDMELSAMLNEILAQHQSAPESVGEIIRKMGRAGSEANSRICSAKVTYARQPVLRRSAYAGMMFNGAGRPIRPDGTSSTLPASMGGNKTPIVDEAQIFDGQPSFVEAYHKHLIGGGEPRTGNAPGRLRRLTVDECLAIQTFPRGFRLAGPQSAMYRQIGNAVPCKLAKAIAETVREVIERRTGAVIA